MNSYDESLKALSKNKERLTIQFKGYTPAFINYVIEKELLTDLQEYSRTGTIGDLARIGMQNFDFDRGREITFPDFPLFCRRYNGLKRFKSTVGIDGFLKKFKDETYIYQFNISLKRDLDKQSWVPWFDGYAFARTKRYPFLAIDEAGNGNSISCELFEPKNKKVEELGRKLLGARSVELLTG